MVTVNAFLRKLGHGARLTTDDERVLAGLATSTHRIDKPLDFASDDTKPRCIPLVLDGWACRYAHLGNGKRQIVSVLLPGDLCEPFGTAAPAMMTYPLAALTPVRFVRVPLDGLRDAWQASPRIEKALWWDLLFFDALQREQIISLGRRSATERLGHLFCELHLRLSMVGLTDDLSFDIPLTQLDIADLSGLSSVHVNRSLQELRGSGLLSLRDRRLVIHRLKELREMAMFDPGYLDLHSTIER